MNKYLYTQVNLTENFFENIKIFVDTWAVFAKILRMQSSNLNFALMISASLGDLIEICG